MFGKGFWLGMIALGVVAIHSHIMRRMTSRKNRFLVGLSGVTLAEMIWLVAVYW